MSDTSNLPPPANPALPVRVGEGDDRILPAAVYILFLVGLINGLTIVVGVLIAYAFRDKAGPMVRSHYVFQARSCWMGLAIGLLGALLIAVGIPLSLVLVGIPLVAIGFIILSVIGVWFAVRCVFGLYYLSQNQPYPRPDTWLV